MINAGGLPKWIRQHASRGGSTSATSTSSPCPNIEDPEAHLLEQDVIWVNGGSVVNLLAVWRAHGLDGILRKAWKSGVVLAASQRLHLLVPGWRDRLLWP